VYYRTDKDSKFDEYEAYYELVPKYQTEVIRKFTISMLHGTKATIEFYTKCKEGVSNILKVDLKG
jgi:hypothetical protein